MIKSLTILKFRKGPQGPSQRTLRRAVQDHLSSLGKMSDSGPRVRSSAAPRAPR